MNRAFNSNRNFKKNNSNFFKNDQKNFKLVENGAKKTIDTNSKKEEKVYKIRDSRDNGNLII